MDSVEQLMCEQVSSEQGRYKVEKSDSKGFRKQQKSTFILILLILLIIIVGIIVIIIITLSPK